MKLNKSKEFGLKTFLAAYVIILEWMQEASPSFDYSGLSYFHVIEKKKEKKRKKMMDGI